MKQTLLEWEGAPTSFEEVQMRLVKTAGHVVGSFQSYEQAIVEADMTQVSGAGRSELLKPVFRSFKGHLGDLERLYSLALELGPPLRDVEPLTVLRELEQQNERQATEQQPDVHLGAEEPVETSATLTEVGDRAIDGMPDSAAAWPQPNEHGAFALEMAEKLEHTEKGSSAQVHVLQVGPEEWISSWSVSLRMGGIWPALTRQNVYASRDGAIAAAASALFTYLDGDVTGDRAVPKLKRWAENVIGQHAEAPDAPLPEESQEALAPASA